MKELFMHVQEPQYYERMMLIYDRKLADIIKLGVKIEEGLKKARITYLKELQVSYPVLPFRCNRRRRPL